VFRNEPITVDRLDQVLVLRRQLLPNYFRVHSSLLGVFDRHKPLVELQTRRYTPENLCKIAHRREKGSIVQNRVGRHHVDQSFVTRPRHFGSREGVGWPKHTSFSMPPR
jgi:hypothetical protein